MIGKKVTYGLCVAVVLAAVGGVSAVLAAPADVQLPEAAMRGEIEVVRSLLKQDIDVDSTQGDGMTALHWAALRDNLEMAKLLMESGANVTATTRLGDLTPLFLACTHGNAGMIDLLLEAGGDPNTANTVNGQTALMRAAASGDADGVGRLLDAGAKVNARETAYGQTALMFAAADNRAEVIRVLARTGADIETASKVEDLTSRSRYDETGRALPPPPPGAEKDNPPVDFSQRPKANVMGGLTALMFAARDGQMDAVRALLEAGADVNRVSPGDFSSPIVYATANANFDVAMYLLEQRANPNAANNDGLTPLFATIDIEYAPLSWAPVHLTTGQRVGHLELMEALLQAGANPNARLTRKLFYRPSSHDRSWVRTEGATAFWRAAAAADLEAMKLLVAGGANPKVATDEGVTPLAAAAGIGWVPGEFSQTSRDPHAHLAAVEYCLELGLDVNAGDEEDQTPLHGAAWIGDHELIQFLVDKGARLDVQTEKGWYVTDMPNGVDVAGGLPTERPETVEFLMKLGAPAPVAPKAGDGVPRKSP